MKSNNPAWNTSSSRRKSIDPTKADKSKRATRYPNVNMKLKTTCLLLPLATSLALPARAIEAPEDDAPPPAAALDAAAPKEAEPGKPAAAEKTAYLGVTTTEIPEMLNDHLGLKPGDGIIVRSVLPDGPAAKAGIAVNDVIRQLNGKAVGTAADLTASIRDHKPGDKVKLAVIQKGKETAIEVTLGERPDQVAGLRVEPLDQLRLQGMPDELADRVRRMIEGNLGGNDPAHPAPQIEDAMRQMKERMEKAMGGIKIEEGMLNLEGPGLNGGIEVQRGATFRMMDENGSVEFKSNDGSKEVTVRDKDNNITWTGPWDTEQDKAAAPDDVRKRVERLNIDDNFKGNGFRLNIRPGGAEPE